MAGKRNRDSNLEILRILCILAIIGDHFTGQASISEWGGLWQDLFYCAVTSLSRVACSVFIIISAWFSIDRGVKIKKILHIWLMVITYSVALTLFMYVRGKAGKENLYISFFPVLGSSSSLWFAGYYILLMLLSPMLNLTLEKMNRSISEFVLFFLSIFVVLYPTISARLGVFSSDLFVLIFLYLLTGYIKKYRNDLPKSKRFVLAGISIWGGVTLLRALSFLNSGSRLYIWSLIQEYCEFYRARMQTIPNLIIAYSLFFGFKNLKVRNSKIINLLASATLGVYCFHQVPLWYDYLWSEILNAPYYKSILHGVPRMGYTVLCIFLVWLVGTGIELVRNAVSVRAVESRKWYNNLCERIDLALEFRQAYGNEDGIDGQETISTAQNTRKTIKRIVTITAIYFVIMTSFLRADHWIRPYSANENIAGIIQFELETDLDYEDGRVTGTVSITNNGQPVIDPSEGANPVHLGVSIVDPERNIVDLDYAHLSIPRTGYFEKGEKQDVMIDFNDIDINEYLSQGYGIRFAIVQEGISWIEDTAVFYWPES